MRQNDNVPKNKENLAENSPENDSTHISKPDEVVGAEKTDSTESHSVNPEDYADEANEREANRELAADHAIDEEEDAETQDDPAHDDEALEISEAEDAETEDAEEEDAEEEINSEVTEIPILMRQMRQFPLLLARNLALQLLHDHARNRALVRQSCRHELSP
jgi:hypothetical protein